MTSIFKTGVAALMPLLFCQQPLCANPVLQGNVSNEKGRIGIREDWERRITRVHPGSPAEKAGLRAGDKVVEVDDHKGDYPIIGGAHETVKVVIDRVGQRLTFFIRRVPFAEINTGRRPGPQPPQGPADLSVTPLTAAKESADSL